MRILRVVLFLIAILAGVAAGLYYGWSLNPITPAAGSLSDLRQDYHTDYVLMVAETYQFEQNLPLAASRLSTLGTETPARLVQLAILKATELNYSNQDVETLAKLSQALLTQPTAQGTAKP
jgi:hypothetical protein